MVDLNEPRIEALCLAFTKYPEWPNELRARKVTRAYLDTSAIAVGLKPGYVSFSPEELDLIEAHLKVQGVWSI